MLNQDKNKLIFDLLQAALFQKEITLPENIDWSQILQEMKLQTIAGLPYEWLCNKNVLDEKTKRQWNQTVVFQMTFWVKLMQEQEALIQLMNENNIDMVILKGAAAAIYYPRPDLRAMGDIDFLVHPQEFEKTYHILLEHGYELAHPEGPINHHIVFKKHNIIFEFHNTLPTISKIKDGIQIQKLIINGLSHIEQRYIEHWQIPMLPRLQNGLVLLLHIVQHLKSGLGLRQIVDWMEFVDKELNDEIWRTEFQPILQTIKLEKFAMTLTRICQIHLGLTTENITWCHSINPSLCNELLKYFMEKGNFGRKVKEKGVYVLSVDKNLLGFLKKLQHNGRINWKLTERYYILRPFAWIYQIGRYLKLGFHRKYPIRTFIKDLKKSRKRVQLFNELKLFEK